MHKFQRQRFLPFSGGPEGRAGATYLRKFRQQRRGGIYLLVVGMAMLVGTISAGALMAVRVQLRTGSAGTDFSVARLCARAGIEAAMGKIKTDPYWRTHLGNGAWYSNVALGQGAFSVSAADPVSGDITIASNHPVVLTATGTKGAASYTLQVQVQVNLAAVSCVEVSACSGGDTILTGSTLTSDQTVTANGRFTANSGSVINAKVETYGGITGTGTYNKTTQVISQPRILPDPVHVFDTYKTNGTAIPFASLYQSNTTQIVPNPSFETNVSGWYVYAPSSGSVTITQNSNQEQDGSYSLLVSSRATTGDVPAVDLPLKYMRNGDIYAIRMPVFLSGTGNVAATLVLQSDTGTQSFSTPSVALLNSGGNAWVIPTGNVTASWTGNLTKATLTLTCTKPTGNLYVDKISVTDTGLPLAAYVMDRILLSPSSNPYGAVNAQGIYILDCAGVPVTIGPCRIVGTLVLLRAGSGTTIQGPINWEPAISGYPALLADQPIAISFDSGVALSESTLGVNFNPSGTPYPYSGGSANTTVADAFPSIINGVIYCGGDLTVATAAKFRGSVITAGKLNLNATSTTLTYGNDAFVSPPPGFITALPALYPVPGSWQRVTH